MKEFRKMLTEKDYKGSDGHKLSVNIEKVYDNIVIEFKGQYNIVDNKGLKDDVFKKIIEDEFDKFISAVNKKI